MISFSSLCDNLFSSNWLVCFFYFAFYHLFYAFFAFLLSCCLTYFVQVRMTRRMPSSFLNPLIKTLALVLLVQSWNFRIVATTSTLSTAPCDGTMELNDISGFIDDGYDPTYPNDLLCGWVINPLFNGVPAQVPFNLTFSKVDLESGYGECNVLDCRSL